MSTIELTTASLADLDPDLVEGIPAEHLAAARERMPVTVARIEAGTWSLDQLGLPGRQAFAIAVVDGLLIRDHVVGDRTTSELLGPGDIVGHRQPRDPLLTVVVSWTAAQPLRIALLDERIAAVMHASPVVGLRLLDRLAQQSSRVAVQRAIAHLPRVEDRLLALFLHLAERWGRVGNGGVILPVALTHATLGRLVGARRPTVSLALKELTSEGLLARRDDGAWIVSHASRTTLAAPAQPPAPPPKLAILASATVHTVRQEHAGTEVSVAEEPIARLLE